MRARVVVMPAVPRVSCGSHLEEGKGLMNARRLVLTVSVVVVGVLICACGSALAAALETPELTVESPVPATTASLHGVLNPKATTPGEAGSYEFLYKQGKAGCAGGTAAPVPAGLMMGLEHEEVFQGLSGLTADTEYSVCLRAETATHEMATSPVVTFKTALPPEKPETLSPAKSITATSAVFEGVLNPKSASEGGTYEFIYRVSPSECEGEGATGPQGQAGLLGEKVKLTASPLQPNAHYMFCLLARNRAGETAVGAPVPFTTPPAKPSIESENVSSVKATGARLEGVVNPNNQATECKIQYGSEPALTTPTTVPCEPALLNNFGGQGVGVTVGLGAKTTYYYRVVATNGTGTNEGPIEHFTTPTPPETPTTTAPATAITTSSATLEGVLNPGGKGEAGSYEFAYRQSANECQKTNPETGQPENEKATPTTSAPAGTDAVKAPVEGLAPGAQYTFCLLSRNEAGETALGAPVTFRTSAVPPTITGESVTEVTATSANLTAQIDPGGAETTYHFDYGTTTAYGQSTPESAPVGSDNSEHPAATEVQSLLPSTVYHYRIVASNSNAPGGISGPDRSFTTQSSGGRSVLPDGRSYEIVSPLDKGDGEVLGIAGGGLTPTNGDATQASEDGKSVSYIMSAPLGINPPGNTLSSQIFSSRSGGEWASKNISIPHPTPIDGNGDLNGGEEFVRFSSDLSHAIVMPISYKTPEPPLAPEIHQEVKAGEDYKAFAQEIYVRDNLSDAFRAVQTSEPLPVIAFEGASPDLSHIIFEGPAGLDPKYPLAGGLYEWTDGKVQLVSVLPDREPGIGESLLGNNSRWVNGMIQGPTLGAVSDDGSRVLWTNAGNLYSRDTVSQETILVGSGVFQTATSDGSRVFYDNNGELFVFDVLDKARVDLGATSSIIGTNEEGTVVYEISPAVLTSAPNGEGESASNGTSNLYMLREIPAGSGTWSPTFITARAEQGGGGHVYDDEPFLAQEMHVSPNGVFLAFMSQQSLTGYDNRDVNSGQPDEEVYLYDGHTNSLVCASCDPTGARPVGAYDEDGQFPEPPTDPFGVWENHWIAATIPGWTPNGKLVSTGYQPRSLSDSGRLFFNSTDGLVPQDVNGRDDVYEYEPTGVGSCQSPGFGLSPSFARDRFDSGCVGLISAGTGSTDSVFFDASATGNDVFFTTQDDLVSQDQDGTADMYDARVCSATEPCAPSLVLPPACTSTDSCRRAPSPQPGVFASPASATFAGAGNVTPPVAKTVKPKPVKKRVETKARKLAKALKECGKRRGRTRAVCEARARKRYGNAMTRGRRIKR
jgi:hypothetical protein